MSHGEPRQDHVDGAQVQQVRSRELEVAQAQAVAKQLQELDRQLHDLNHSNRAAQQKCTTRLQEMADSQQSLCRDALAGAVSLHEAERKKSGVLLEVAQRGGELKVAEEELRGVLGQLSSTQRATGHCRRELDDAEREGRVRSCNQLQSMSACASLRVFECRTCDKFPCASCWRPKNRK